MEQVRLSFETDGGIGHRARIGLVVLATDLTIEDEFRALLRLDGVAFHTARLRSDPVITPRSLRDIEPRLEEAAALLLPGMALNAVAYACTSGSIIVGQRQVAACIHRARPGVPVTTPAMAAVAALRALKKRRIALVTPYDAAVNELVHAWFQENGFAVTAFASFLEGNDLVMPRISPASIRRAVLETGAAADVEAVFVSCTSLRLLDQALALENTLGKPVISSNLALGWHCLRLAGAGDRLPQHGSLFEQPLL